MHMNSIDPLNHYKTYFLSIEGKNIYTDIASYYASIIG